MHVSLKGWLKSRKGAVCTVVRGMGFAIFCPCLAIFAGPILTHRFLLTGVKFFLAAKFAAPSAQDAKPRKP
jgi:hypothetical protein